MSNTCSLHGCHMSFSVMQRRRRANKEYHRVLSTRSFPNMEDERGFQAIPDSHSQLLPNRVLSYSEILQPKHTVGEMGKSFNSKGTEADEKDKIFADFKGLQNEASSHASEAFNYAFDTFLMVANVITVINA